VCSYRTSLAPSGSSLRTNIVTTQANRWVVVAGIGSLIAGAALSHVIEPGVRVEAVTVEADTPAIRLFPAEPGRHPVALLGHGVTGSKESLFRYGEALAAAGFDCFSMDFPGHGASRRPFSRSDIASKPAEVAQALGPVDVFVGHSMGAGAGAWSVRESGFSPRLFVAVGADPDLGERGPPLLLLAGQFEELVRPDRLKARTDARLVLSPWSDHALELLDPRLVNSAVEAACETVRKKPPAAPTAWLWRLAGLVLAMAGALGLSLCLPELHPGLARARGVFVAVCFIVALVLTIGRWFAWAPYLHRIPLQLALIVVIWLALAGIRKLDLPRWSITAFAAILALGCVILAATARPGSAAYPFHLLSLVMVIATLLLLSGTILGYVGSYRGTPRDGDITMAIFAGYAIGQWIPKFF